MIRRPPRSTRTDTLFPYTTLFRSDVDAEKFDRDFRPMAASTNAPVVYYGTPWGAGSLLARARAEHLEAERRDGIRRCFRFDWTAVAEHVPAYASYVAGERERLGERHPPFRTQYLLEENGRAWCRERGVE